MSSYAELMRELRQASQNFHKEWRRWKEGKLTHQEKLKLKGREPATVTLARDHFFVALNRLYNTKIYPLEIKFQANPLSAVDEIIEFLSIDILAHRCGYAKEYFLKQLKRIELSSAQKHALKRISLTLCEVYNFHREFRRWCRLAIIIADNSFVSELKELSASSNKYAQIKSKWMLEIIARHRKDLAKAFISLPE